jgi:type I restriction enzyme S subunit
MTELGLLPEEWQSVRVGDYCTVFSGYPFRSQDFCDNGNLVVKIGNLQNGNIELDSRTSYFPSDKITDQIRKYILRENDILIALTGATTGKTAVVPSKFDGSLLNQRVGKFYVFDDNLFGPFARFYFTLEGFQEKVKKNILQSAQGNVSPKQVENINIPLPPLAEQKAIARVLSAIQRTVEAQDKIIAAARELKKSLMRHLFTYGPVPVSEAERVPLKETEIGSLPEHWEVIKLADLFIIKQGKSLSPQHRLGLNPQPFLRTANVFWGKVDLSTLDRMDFLNQELEQLCLKPDDLLVCEGGEIGRTAIWEGQLEICFYQNHLHRLRATRDDVYPLFYMYWMQAAYLLLGLYGGTGNKTTIPNLSQSRLKSFLLPKPSFHEQKDIAKQLKTLDVKLESEKNSRTALQTLFKTMLHLLMTGKVRVKDLEATPA